jgi:hypothetical protein
MHPGLHPPPPTYLPINLLAYVVTHELSTKAMRMQVDEGIVIYQVGFCRISYLPTRLSKKCYNDPT